MEDYKERKKLLTLAHFPYLIHVILSNDPQTARKRRDKIFGQTYVRDASTRAMHSALDEWPESYLFLEFNTDIGFIVHEAYHAVWRIMEFIGAKHEEEIMAYHLGWLTREIVRFISRTHDTSPPAVPVPVPVPV
jgi:hypothetical protein